MRPRFAATSNANTILFFLLGAVFGVGMAATISVGQSMGAQDLDRAKRVIGTSIVFFVGISILIAAVGLPGAEVLMRWLHTAGRRAAAGGVLPAASSSSACRSSTCCRFSAWRCAGPATRARRFCSSCSTSCSTSLLNPLFIFGFGPVPRMGIAGSATASVAAQIITLAALIGYLYRSKHFLVIHSGENRYLRVDCPILKALFTKGIPMGLQMIVMSLSMLAMISLVNRFGAHTTAAYGACFQLWNYIQMPSIAIGMAAASMAAQNVGAGKWDRVHRVAMARRRLQFPADRVAGAS